MKKLLVYTLVLVFGLAFVACSSGGSASSREANSSAPPASSATTAFSGDVAGTIDGQVYNNEFAELTFTAPADWMYTDQPVMDMNVASLTEIVNVSIEPDAGASLEEHLELISSGLIETQAAYGYERVDGFTQATIRGNVYTVMEFDAEPFGAPLKQYYVSRAKQGYIIDIIITCPNSDAYQNILGFFS